MSRRVTRGMRLHIGLFGRRNVGKSTLLNALCHQDVAIVSSTAGTTTDPVEKPMEFLPLGPVLFIDTAGIDDVGALGEKRVAKTRRVMNRADLAVIVCAEEGFGAFEQGLLEAFGDLLTQVVVVFNKCDLLTPDSGMVDKLKGQGISVVFTGMGRGLYDLREALLNNAPKDFFDNPAIAGDLVAPGQTAILVVPIDKEAPKGRLILPQQQTIRDLLEHDVLVMVVKERELRAAIENLKVPPGLVITDSQAFLKVAADVPLSVPLTSFSILFSRFKGDLATQVAGAAAIDHLKPNDRVLVAEACTHHPIGEDIGRVKIPRWLTQYVGGALQFTTVSGHDFPEDLAEYQLVIHCGGCMFNRKGMMSRLLLCKQVGVPVTNYGLAIAHSLGILDRALSPFPELGLE